MKWITERGHKVADANKSKGVCNQKRPHPYILRSSSARELRAHLVGARPAGAAA